MSLFGILNVAFLAIPGGSMVKIRGALAPFGCLLIVGMCASCQPYSLDVKSNGIAEHVDAAASPKLDRVIISANKLCNTFADLEGEETSLEIGGKLNSKFLSIFDTNIDGRYAAHKYKGPARKEFSTLIEDRSNCIESAFGFVERNKDWLFPPDVPVVNPIDDVHYSEVCSLYQSINIRGRGIEWAINQYRDGIKYLNANLENESQEQVEKALIHLCPAATIIGKRGSTSEKVNLFDNLGYTIMRLAAAEGNMEYNRAAVSSYRIALENNQHGAVNSKQGWLESNMGRAYYALGKSSTNLDLISKSIEYHKRAVDITQNDFTKFHFIEAVEAHVKIKPSQKLAKEALDYCSNLKEVVAVEHSVRYCMSIKNQL